MLIFCGLADEREARLRELIDAGCAVTIERSLENGRECIIELRERRVTGRGPTADEAASDALSRWDRRAA
jgi:hypothetical protein